MLAGQSKEITAYIQEIQDLLGDKENKDMKPLQAWTLRDCSQTLLLTWVRGRRPSLPGDAIHDLPQQIPLCTKLERLEPKHDASLTQKA